MNQEGAMVTRIPNGGPECCYAIRTFCFADHHFESCFKRYHAHELDDCTKENMRQTCPFCFDQQLQGNQDRDDDADTPARVLDASSKDATAIVCHQVAAQSADSAIKWLPNDEQADQTQAALSEVELSRKRQRAIPCCHGGNADEVEQARELGVLEAQQARDYWQHLEQKHKKEEEPEKFIEKRHVLEQDCSRKPIQVWDEFARREGGQPEVANPSRWKVASPLSKSARSHKATANTAFVLRTFGAAKLNLIEEYATALDGVAQFWVHYDSTSTSSKVATKALSAIRSKAREIENLHLFVYNSSVVKSTYPTGTCFLVEDREIPWSMHEPCIMAWLVSIGMFASTPDRKLANETCSSQAGSAIDYVWVMEDDTKFAGDVAEFVEFYKTGTLWAVTLIHNSLTTPNLNRRICRIRSHWSSSHRGRKILGYVIGASSPLSYSPSFCATGNYGQRTAQWDRHISGLQAADPEWLETHHPADKNMMKFERSIGRWQKGAYPSRAFMIAEHIMRFSSRLLCSVHQSMTRNEMVWGEALTTTLCASSRWCSVRDISDDGFVPPSQATLDWTEWYTRITNESWGPMLNNCYTKNKWYHATKWWN